MSISITNVSKSYKDVKALQNITFDVKPGELFGLIGPDGAGKTTLFRILTTLLLADEGIATVAGFDVIKDYKTIRNSVGYMPGKFSLYQDLTVEENLNFFATIFGTTIEENYDLDEPTTGVDPVSRKEFWDMLKRLQKHGITILVSTPYMDEAALCDRIALIQNGKILEINTPEEIVKHYPKTIFNVSANNMYQLIKSLKVYEHLYSIYPFGEFVHYSDKREKFNSDDLKHYLETQNLSDIQINQTQPTIEDTFMELAK